MDTLLQEVNNLLKDYEETKNAFKELSEFNALLQEELRLARDQERNAESKKARYQDFLKQQQEIIQTLLAVKEENENLKCKLNQTEITLSMVQNNSIEEQMRNNAKILEIEQEYMKKVIKVQEDACIEAEKEKSEYLNTISELRTSVSKLEDKLEEKDVANVSLQEEVQNLKFQLDANMDTFHKVMAEVQREFVEYGNCGVSVLEMSHRSAEYEAINNSAQQVVRELLNIPETYSILFMQGGGTGLFCAVAMNLMSRSGKADYFVTGSWSAKAAKEAAKYGKVNLVLPKADSYTDVPPPNTWKLDPEASYVYYCDNETVHGLEFAEIPDTKGVPLVVDMSSNMLTRPFDITKFGVVFAGAQKNIGPAGAVLVIIRRDLLGSPLPITPLVWDFTVMTKDNSLHNTPPTFAVFVMLRVFEWIKRQGGVQAMQARSAKKSSLIYDTIKNSGGFYLCPVKPQVRSRVNIPFRLAAGDKLEAKFLSEAKQRNMIELKGHRMVGGIRASLYNAMTVEEAQILADFMKEFQKANS